MRMSQGEAWGIRSGIRSDAGEELRDESAFRGAAKPCGGVVLVAGAVVGAWGLQAVPICSERHERKGPRPRNGLARVAMRATVGHLPPERRE